MALGWRLQPQFMEQKTPAERPQYRRLGKWVSTQRTHYKRGTIKPERVRFLNELGFIWNTKKNGADAVPIQ
jgi:hypothetical protein